MKWRADMQSGTDVTQYQSDDSEKWEKVKPRNPSQHLPVLCQYMMLWVAI